MPRKSKKGDTVSVHYKGRIKDGETFDSSAGREPLTFTIGRRQVVPGFDKAVVGMAVGEKRTVTIPPEEGYGPRRVELVVDIPKSGIPPEMVIRKGIRIELIDPQGNRIPAQVVDILENVVKMDLNHSLAGKTLVFEIELVSISDDQG